MFVVGRQNQQAGHGQCGPRLSLSLINHFTDLSSERSLVWLTRRVPYPSGLVAQLAMAIC